LTVLVDGEKGAMQTVDVRHELLGQDDSQAEDTGVFQQYYLSS
jgi:hypothetical protein